MKYRISEKTVIRIGAAVIAAAIGVRLLAGGALTAWGQALSQPQVAELMILLQTGRSVHLEDALSYFPLSDTEEQVQTQSQSQPREETGVTFTAQDSALVEIRNDCGYSVDTAALLTQPLSWDLSTDAPTVLILHTHGTEGYADTDGYRSEDEGENVLAIGDEVAKLLEAGGVQVVHDRTMHDRPSYNGSYNHARTAIRQYLEKYPSIQLVLDIHRDAAEDDSGNQIHYTVTTEQGEAAKLMLVVGTDAGGLTHPNWQENMALAVKLHAQLEKNCSGLCRPISFRASRFNQDLSAGAVLVEVGAAGNTRQEALLAAKLLAQGILDLADGTA